MSKLFGSRLCGNRGRIFTIDICLTSFHFYLFPNIQVAGLSLIEGVLKSTDGINDFIKTRHFPIEHLLLLAAPRKSQKGRRCPAEF